MLKEKNINSLSDETMKIIRLVSTLPDTKPVGSYLYRIQKFPGDIDMMEQIIKIGSREEAGELLDKDMRRIIYKVKSCPKVYFADFKAGVDPAFKIDIGRMKNFRSVVGYKRGKILTKLGQLKRNGYLTKLEYDVLRSLTVPKPTLADWYNLKEAIRKKYILRWSPAEIIQGFKKLPGLRIKEFKKAIAEDSISKIDVWAWLNNKYVEVTDYFITYYIPKGQRRTVKIFPSQPEFEYAMKHDATQFFSPFFYNPMKSIKRMWALAMRRKDIKMLKKINPLLTSGYMILYQVIGDIKTLKDLLGKIVSPNFKNIRREIGDFKERLSHIYEFDYNEDVINQQLDILFDMFRKSTYTDDRTNKIAKMGEIAKELQIILNKNMQKYIDKHIKPIPKSYLLPKEK